MMRVGTRNGAPTTWKDSKSTHNIDATVVSRNLVAIAQRCLRCSTNNNILCCNTSSWTNAIVGFAQMKSSVVLTYITWIMKDRFDSFYKNSFLAGNTTLRDLDDTKVHVPCAAHGWGVCDTAALVPRPFMSSYFSLPFSVVTECWSMDVLYTECFSQQQYHGKNWEENNLVTNGAVYPECFLRLKMMRASTRMSDYAGAITTNTIVRDCDCDDARVMKPWESCGHVLDHVSRERSHCAVTL